MRVVVTGATGFIGKYVMRTLQAETDWEVVGLTRRPSDDPALLVTDYSKEQLATQLCGTDVVIHLAAIRPYRGSSYTELLQNEVLTDQLLCAMQQSGTPCVAYASSISVYSDLELLPWSETQPLRPKSPYGLTKQTCEGLMQLASGQGLRFAALRLAHVLGEGEVGGYMMNTFLDCAAQKRSLCVTGKSVAKREFVYVKDVALAFLWAAKELMAQNPAVCNQALNVGYGVGYTNLEIAQMVNRVFDNEGNLSYDDSQPEGCVSSYLDVAKLSAAGFRPRYSFVRALEDIRAEKASR